MYLSQELKTWKARWAAVDTALADINPSSCHARGKTLSLLRDSLRFFAERQFFYFFDGVNPRVTNFKLARCKDFPRDYIFNMLLQQMQDDFAIIRRAVQHRQAGSKQEKMALLLGDLFAQGALKPAVAAGVIEETAVLTYFEKSKNTRIIPYAPVSLIGIPIMTTHVLQDYLAIPHEAGHYVYRNGQLEEMPIPERITLLYDESTPDYLMAWAEEIFADVYGTIVAGAVMALDFQDLLLTHSRANFMRDDGEHPIESIRPYIYSKTLQLLGKGGEADALNGRWEQWLNKRGNPLTFLPHGSETPVNLAEARTVVESFVTKLVGLMGSVSRIATPDELLPLNDGGKTAVQTKVAANADRSLETRLYSKLEAQFEAAKAQFTPDNAPLTELEPKSTDALHDAGKRQTNTAAKAPFLLPSGLLHLLTDPANRPTGRIPAATWQTVLDANGWAFRGPNCPQGGGLCG